MVRALARRSTASIAAELRSDPTDGVATRRAGLALATAATAMLLISFVSTATNIAVATLVEEFDAPLATVSWVVSAFNICQVTLMLLGGRIADRRGRKRVFLAGLALFGLGSAASALAPALGVLIVARVVQAAGAALILPASLVAVLPEYPPSRHASVVSLWSSMGVVGATVAPTLSAVLLSVAGWRSVFVAALPVVAIAALAGRRLLRESKPTAEPGPLDVVGAVAGTLAVGGLAVALVQGRVWGWTAAPTLAAAVLAVVAAVTFARQSLHHPEPLLDVRIFAERTFSATALASAALSIAGGATWFLYPLFMRDVWGFSVFQIGLGMSPGSAVMVLVTLGAGRLIERVGYRRQLVAGSAVVVGGVAWMATFMTQEASYAFGFLPGTMMIGIGMGLVVGPLNAAALRHVGTGSLGAANGAFNTMRFLGSALGVALAAAVLGATEGAARTAAFDLAFTVTAAMSAAAPLLLAFGFPRDGTTAARAGGSTDVAARPAT